MFADLDERGATAMIAQHPRRSILRKIDKVMYQRRHLIENFFCKPKEFKRIAMRAEETDRDFAAMINLTAAEAHDEARQALIRHAAACLLTGAACPHSGIRVSDIFAGCGTSRACLGTGAVLVLENQTADEHKMRALPDAHSNNSSNKFVTHR